MTSRPFATVLASTARELETLAALATDIDRAIGQLTVTLTIDGRTNATLQKVDLLRQSLECIALYVNNLVGQLNDTNQIDPATAAASLTLRDLACKLAGDKEVGLPAEQSTGQDVCFF